MCCVVDKVLVVVEVVIVCVMVVEVEVEMEWWCVYFLEFFVSVDVVMILNFYY